MGKLTAAKVKALKKPGMHGDGGTLYLRIAPGGSKQWIQRIVINGKRRDLGLGGYPLVSLAEARLIAFDNRRAARIQGRDPLAEKRRERMPTFAEAADKYHAANKAQWRSERHAQIWMSTISRYALPEIGERRVDEIDQADVLRILTPIWNAKGETAKRLRRFIRSVFSWAQAHKFRADNPAGEAIDGALPRLPKVAANFRALPFVEIPDALETIEASGLTTAKLAFRFLVLTASRSGEIRNAAWSEIDLDARTWTIPADRMKSAREHRIPLCDEAIAVLEEAREFSDGSDLVFPSPMKPGKPLSDMSLTKILRDNDLAKKATAHGMRSSFRDWCGERGVDREVAEAALAHVVGGVEGAYFRSDLFERRREVMQSWGAFVAGGERGGKVVAIRGA